MNNRVVVLTVMLAVMLVTAPFAQGQIQFGDKPETPAVGAGAVPSPEPDNSVSLTPPPAPLGAKGEKGERGEAGPQGPAGRSGTVTYLVYNAWLAKSENQHYNRWAHSGSHQEQNKRCETLYDSWKKQIEESIGKVKARLDSVETVASAASSSATYAHERVTQALRLGGENAGEINRIKGDVESLKNGTIRSNSTTSASVTVVPEGPSWPTADAFALLAIVIVVLGAVVAAGIFLF